MLTSVNLYRSGNAGGPRMTNVRPQDIIVRVYNHVEWVDPGTGGISTFSAAAGLGQPVWRLNSPYNYNAQLVVVNDRGNHYTWAPAISMTKENFISLLAAVNPAFVRNQSS